jgi:hypothetical protein
MGKGALPGQVRSRAERADGTHLLLCWECRTVH